LPIVFVLNLFCYTSFWHEHQNLKSTQIKVRTPRVGMNAPENSFIVKSSRLWNNLPDKLSLTFSIDCFKSALKNMYLEGYKEAYSLWHSYSYNFDMYVWCYLRGADIALCNINKLSLQLMMYLFKVDHHNYKAHCYKSNYIQKLILTICHTSEHKLGRDCMIITLVKGNFLKCFLG
jgi:hypothetical protein